MEEINNMEDFLKSMAAKKEYSKGLKLNLRDEQISTKEVKALARTLRSRQCPQGLQLILFSERIDGVNVDVSVLESEKFWLATVLF